MPRDHFIIMLSERATASLWPGPSGVFMSVTIAPPTRKIWMRRRRKHIQLSCWSYTPHRNSVGLLDDS